MSGVYIMQNTMVLGGRGLPGEKEANERKREKRRRRKKVVKCITNQSVGAMFAGLKKSS